MPQVSDYTALLSGASLHGTSATGAFYTYSFPTGVPQDYQGVYSAQALATFRPLTEAEKNVVRAALEAWASVSGLTFFEVPAGEGDMRFSAFDMSIMRPGAAGFAYYPSGTYDSVLASDVFLDLDYAGNMHVILHEIGHAIGLKHTFDDDVTLVQSLDHYGTSVMSYTSGGYAGDVLGTLDDDAVQYLYGGAAADGTQVASWSWNAATYTLTQGGSALGDTILGVGGRDQISAGGGNDEVHARGGNDLVHGGSGNDTLYGDGGSDDLRGEAGDDTLDGGQGDDTLTGADGQDNLSGWGGDDRLSGGTENDTLYGGDGNDVLNGEDGNDSLQCGTGVDEANGGLGDDNIYLTVGAGVTVFTVDGGGGTDFCGISLAWDFAGAVSLPQLLASGSSMTSIESVAIWGNENANTITGGEGAEYISGGGGGDVLNGGRGGDTLAGGAGADRFVYTHVLDSVDGAQDYISGFESGLDKIDLGALGNVTVTWTDGTYSGGGAYSFVTVVVGASTMSIFVNGGVAAGDFLFEAPPIVLSGGTGNDMLEGGSGDDQLNGNGGADTLTGLGGDDRLNGGTGGDRMSGGDGDDTYWVDDAGDRVIEGSASGGTDTVYSAISFSLAYQYLEKLILTGAALNATGNSLNNTLVGTSANNVLDGMGGVDVMNGGAGNDTYVVDQTGDTVIEAAGGGTDTVLSSATYSLSRSYEIENLTLTGFAAVNAYGNHLANVITGNDNNNVLNGSTGADTMIGKGGTDTYYVDNAGDVVVEASGGGVDTVHSAVSYTLSANVENLGLTGTATHATGNALANRLYGNASNNTLDGGAGADYMTGRGGNDTYIVDNVGDRVLENTASEGTADKILASVSYSLGGIYVETLELTGSAAIDATGNSLANTLVGNSGANDLYGKGGNDRLSGGAGQDGFWFDTALNGSANVDAILDFNVADDTIHLRRGVFSGISADGALGASAFRAGTAAQDADDRIVYDSATGKIWYDADGSGEGAAVLFATVTAGTALTHLDFVAYTG